MATYGDEITRLGDYTGLTPGLVASPGDAGSLRVCRGALDDAYRRLMAAADWSWLFYEDAFSLEAAYSTGTVSVALAGTTVTLTGGTWDTTWASREIQIGNEVYPITIATSSTGTLPRGAVVAASGATYTVFRRKYSLAARMRAGTEFSTQSGAPMQLDIVSPERYAALAVGQVLFQTPPEIIAFNAQDSNLVSQVKVWPAPLTAGSVYYSGYRDAPMLAADASTFLFPERFLSCFRDLALESLWLFRKDPQAKYHGKRAMDQMAELMESDPPHGGRAAKVELSPQRHGPTAFPRPDRHSRVR